VDLHFEPPQNRRHESMRRKTKAGNEKCLKHNPLGSGISSAPGTRQHRHQSIQATASPARGPRKSSKCQTPRCGSVANPSPPNHSTYPRMTGQPMTHSQQTRKRTLLRTTVVARGLLHTGQISEAREQGGQASGLQKLGFSTAQARVENSPGYGCPFYRQDATLRETRSPIVTRPSTVTFQKPMRNHFKRGSVFTI
jgi:hypothetical protein